jgi:hypothetical protein
MRAVITRTRDEVIKLWIKALRSGKYKQTIGSLRNSKGFCCLGVLCDLASKDGGPKWEQGYGTNMSFDGHQCLLPNPIHHFVFDAAESHDPRGLVRDNDSGRSFAEIADRIERELL